MSSDFVELIFRYFPFLACGLNLLNLWAVKDKVTQKVKLFLGSFSALFLIWGLLQMAGGYKTFFFVILPLNQNPLVMLFWIIYFVSLWAGTIWVIWGGGAEELLNNGLVYGQEKLKTPQSIKLFFAVVSIVFPVLVVLGYLSGFFSNTVAGLGDVFF
jgi:hypothetical protein